ncbi:MAG: hypothetical protein K2X03_29195 [Bryobacteraceae bacterium]|nr:hypothetical protein [Bryobacteraceae bacterium]
MSNERANITGSAAREHETSGGNVKAGQSNLPAAGSAAQAAETEKAREEPTGMRATSGMRLPQVRGARMVEAPPPPPDLSQRTAADYLPAHLKAQLIAEGKLTASGQLVTKPPTPPAPEPAPSEETATGVEAAVASTWLGSLVTRLRQLFG